MFSYILSELLGHVKTLLFHILGAPLDLLLLRSQLETSFTEAAEAAQLLVLLCIVSRIALTHTPSFCYLNESAPGVLSTMVSSALLVQKLLLMSTGSSCQRQLNTLKNQTNN